MPFLTIAGEAKIALNQSVNGGLKIVNYVLANIPGLGAEPADRVAALPDPSLIVDTIPYTKRGYVNPNQVVYSIVMGSNVGDYDFNWIGLQDEDGLIVYVSHIPLTPKRKNNGAIPGNTFSRSFLIEYTGIQNITATTVPIETWQIDFSDRLNGIDERERLSNLDIYGHEGFLDDGWKVTGSAGTYSVAAGIGYVGGVRAKNTAPQEITTTIFPNEIWLNVSLQGDISDMTAVAEFVIDTGPFADYVDGNGITHYLTKIADIDAAGEVVEARVMSYLKDFKSPNNKTLFDVSGDENDIVLTSKAGTTKIAKLNDYDEFSFIVSATNTATVTIKVDGLAAMPLAGVVSDTQIFETALLTVRYIAGEFYIASQINPKTGNDVADICKLITDTTDILYPGEYPFNGFEINSADHPIGCAKAAATSNYIAQSAKDAEPIKYGGYYGFFDELDGSVTVTLPIVGGEFIRMHNSGGGADSGRVFGSHQDATGIGIAGQSNGYSGAAWTDSYVSGLKRDENFSVISPSVGGVINFANSNQTLVGFSKWDARSRNLSYAGKTKL